MRYCFHALTLITVVSLIACSDINEPHEAFDVFVSVSPQQLVVGDTARIAVTVINTTSRTRPLDTEGCVIYFEVRSSTGNVVAPEGRYCPLALWVGDLVPGDSLGFTFDWRGERAGEDFLPAGSYRVVGVFDGRTGRRFSAPAPIELVN